MATVFLLPPLDEGHGGFPRGFSGNQGETTKDMEIFLRGRNLTGNLSCCCEPR